MNESSSRESGRPAPHPDAPPVDPPVAVLEATLRRLGGSELACCCALAVTARELCGGRACRVEPAADRPDAAGGGPGPDRDTADGGDAGWHRIPLRGPGATGEPEAWLAVERRGGERSPPRADRLSALASLAGLALERHRLAREVRRARDNQKEIRAVLGHALRGHLHAALLRADGLLMGFRGDGDPDLAEVRGQLEQLKDTVEDMVAEIGDVVDGPDAGGEGSPDRAGGTREDIRVPELLREAARGERAGDPPPRVEVEGEVPAVRADAGRLGPALGELFDLARSSSESPTLSVRSDGSSSGVHVEMSVDLPPLTGPDGGPEDPGAGGAASPGGGTPGGPAGDASGEVGPPSLREVVADLGGRLRIEAGRGSRATVEVVLPADGGG